MSATRRVSRRAAATAARKRISVALSEDGEEAFAPAAASGGPNDRLDAGDDHAPRKRARPADDDGDGEEEGVGAAATAATAAAGEYSAPLPTRNAREELVFPDHPRFRPNLTPKQVLQAGSFGGGYFRPIYSSVVGQRCEVVEGRGRAPPWRPAPPPHLTRRAAGAGWLEIGRSSPATGSRGWTCPAR